MTNERIKQLEEIRELESQIIECENIFANTDYQGQLLLKSPMKILNILKKQLQKYKEDTNEYT